MRRKRTECDIRSINQDSMRLSPSLSTHRCHNEGNTDGFTCTNLTTVESTNSLLTLTYITLTLGLLYKLQDQTL